MAKDTRTQAQRVWARERDELRKASAELGYPEELADLLAGELGSPRSISRMTGYMRQARPHSLEMIMDEMLAIRGEADTWREKKKSQEAQSIYNSILFYGVLGRE